VLTLDVNRNPVTYLPSIGWDDDITSYRLGKNVRAMICSNSGCQGGWDQVQDVVGPYNNPNVGSFNDWTTEIRLFPYNAKTDKYVQVFGNGRYEADQAGLFPLGEYNSYDIMARHIDRGGYPAAASSMKIPAGFRVTIYNGDNFSGERREILGPKDLDFIEGPNEDRRWNDQIRSMIVENIANMDVSVYWDLVGFGSGT
jgi:hypothetical protein